MALSLKQLEELSLSHWPALTTQYMDGWKLRMSNGYTKRANSVSTIHGISKQRDLNIAACEQKYMSAKQPTIFKITPFSEPMLDESLHMLNYTIQDPSLMMTLSLEKLSQQAPLLKLNSTDEVELCTLEHISLQWLEKYCELSGVNPKHIPTMIDMLASIPGKLQLASCIVNNETAALALTVTDQGYIGIYDVITAQHQRNLGLCSYLLWNLLQQAKSNVNSSYLAVVEANEKAQHVYAKLGYTSVYRYWYRIKA